MDAELDNLKDFKDWIEAAFTQVKNIQVLTSHKTPDYAVPYVLITCKGKGE